MNAQELKEQTSRISKYQALAKLRDEIYQALTEVTKDWKEIGPCGQGPFTGNARESRRVKSMHIEFTATRGGAPPVEIKISGMHIEAWDLGRFLESALREKVIAIDKEMEKL